jgi:hypothetical protein
VRRDRPDDRRFGPTLGPRTGVSVPIFVGLPILGIGLALLLVASTTGETLFWVLGGVGLCGGAMLLGSSRQL